MKKPVNFRDLGGIETKENKKIKHKKLLRSGNLKQLDDAEKQALVDDYHLAHVIDFRSKTEFEDNVGVLPKGVEYTNIDLLSKHMGNLPSEEHFKKMNDPTTVHSMMREIYTVLLEGDETIEGYRKFIDILLKQKSGAVLFHCSAGKDRTGVAAAIILTLLGVNEENIMSDFLITNKLRAENNKRVVEEYRLCGKSELEREALLLALSVDESYLKHIFSLAKKTSGSYYEHITKIYNITPEEIDELKSIFTEK